MKRLKQRRWRVVIAAVVALVLAVGAVAYWTGAGSGSSSSTVANADPVTISAGTPTAYLYPGTSADVSLRITNPNPFPVNVPSLVLTNEGTGGFDVDGSNPGCVLSALSYPSLQDNGGPGWTVPGTDALNNYLDLDLTNAVHLSTSAVTECQGLTFKVHLAVGT